jgi:hypothetical protein
MQVLLHVVALGVDPLSAWPIGGALDDIVCTFAMVTNFDPRFSAACAIQYVFGMLAPCRYLLIWH